MTQEEKQLLLVDLSARLPYGVKIELMSVTRGKCVTLTPIILRDYFISDDVNYLPYLRPMSSMTKEEENELRRIRWTTKEGEPRMYEWCDYANAHHLDYRGLIPKGLAIEVTKENNPYED